MAEINKIIKNARDVLVGKVPDPQSQVDQITLALIYKFMDAKDQEASMLGLNKTFFINDCESYSFTKVMQASDNEMQFRLYNKGIELLQYRQDLPETFISVFKDAFIPYRDALTLHLFLAEINKIPTDNTELLGTAFEDLLSIMGSQGDAGQFRTPRHIIEMIVDIVEPKIGETILDPACGTAGFLISAYNKVNKQDMTVEERENFITNGLVGYDINPNMVKLSNVNLFLHGCKKPNIHLYDTLSEKDYWKDNFDVILANPPFMTPKGGIRPHELFSAINANRSEVLFTYYIAKHLKRAGRAGFIVPEGVVFQTANAYKDIRRILIEENYLYAVISLPSGVFNPYSGVKTSVLLLDRNLAKKTDKVLFVKMNNDGFDLGAQRRPIEKNDIPAITEIVKSFAFAVSTETENDFVDNYGLSTVVSKEEIIKNDFVLVGDRYVKQQEINTEYPVYKLEELLDKVKYDLKIPKSQFAGEGKYPIIDQSEKYIAGYLNNREYVYHFEKPVICFGDHTRTIKYVDFDFALGADGVKILLPKNGVDSKFLYYMLRANPIPSHGYSRHYSYLKELIIPLPPIEKQKEIVAEIEQYQKIIDGAKQVVDNYSANFRIKNEWPRKLLSEVCDVRDGTHDSPKFVSDGIPLITSKNIVNGEIDFTNVSYITEEDCVLIEKRSKVNVGDILMPMIGTIGRPIIVNTDKRFAIKNVALIKCGDNPTNKYVLNILKSNLFKDYVASHKRGGTQNFISLTDIRNFEIPLPSTEEQQDVTNTIKKKQQINEGNKKNIKNN